MISQRKDGRGHWPRGRRRKPDTGIAVVTALQQSIRRRGLRATARLLSVDPRTVKRWLRRERFPDKTETAVILELM